MVDIKEEKMKSPADLRSQLNNATANINSLKYFLRANAAKILLISEASAQKSLGT